MELTSYFWRRHLLFRDYLRTHTVALREYADLKRRLAAECGDDGRGYTDAKGSFIESIVGHAEEKVADAASDPS